MSKKRALGRSPAEWDRLVDEWVSSGRTQGEFAEANGINAKTFLSHPAKHPAEKAVRLKF